MNRKQILAIGLSSIFALSASATTIIITPETISHWSGNENSTPAINTAIASMIGSAEELYKQEVGGAESGGLAGSYEVNFSPSTDPSGATITYTGGDVVGPTAFLLVKDGKNEPAWYLFDLTELGFVGTQTLELKNFWPGEGAISHLTLYGGRGSQVADVGSSMALLGMALMGLGAVRRKMCR